MHLKMSQITRKELLEHKRARYKRAGKEHKGKILNEVIELFGYHRKAAIRALQKREDTRAVVATSASGASAASHDATWDVAAATDTDSNGMEGERSWIFGDGHGGTVWRGIG